MAKKQNVPLIISCIVLVAIIIAGIWIFGGKSKPASNTVTDTGTLVDNNTTASSTLSEEGGGGITGTGAGILIDDQNPGRLVTVSQVSLMNPAWVVIKEDLNGKPGTVIGARIFDKGKNSGIVELLRAMVIGKSYFAVVYNEDGDGKFDPKKDLVLKGTNGADVMVKFAVTKATDTQ